MKKSLWNCESPEVAGEKKICSGSLKGVIDGAALVFWEPGVPKFWHPLNSQWPASPSEIIHSRPSLPSVSPITTPMLHATLNLTRTCFLGAIPAARPAFIIPNKCSCWCGSKHWHWENGITRLMCICHLDTQNWAPAHPAFRLLNQNSRELVPSATILPYGNLVFGKK